MKQGYLKLESLNMNNSFMSPLVSGFFRSCVPLTLRASSCCPIISSLVFLLCLILLSSFCLLLRPLFLYQTTCLWHVVELWLRLLWPRLGLSERSVCRSLCGHSPPAASIHNLYAGTRARARPHTDTCTRTACATQSIHCPGAPPDFKLQLAEPEAKLNLEGSSMEVTQPRNNCLSHIF